MKLDPFISELLYEHDCVIVADFGGFIASRKPASINAALHLMTPPSKVIAFNSFLKQNDGVLANYISRKQGITYSDACKLIGDYVRISLSALDEGRRVKVENVGILYRDNNEIIQFLPDQNANYLISSFGMSTIHAPVIQRADEEEEEVQAPRTHIKPIRKVKAGQRKWRIIEVVPAAAMLTFLLMVPPVLDKFNSNLSTLLPFSRINEYIHDFKGESTNLHQVNINYQSPFEVPPVSSSVNDSDTGTASAVNTAPVTETVEEAAPAPTPAPAAPENKSAEAMPAANTMSADLSATAFHIVGGCFKKEANADRFIDELRNKGIEASKAGTNAAGLVVVSVFSSNNKQQVLDALPEFRNSVDPSVWVMERK